MTRSCHVFIILTIIMYMTNEKMATLPFGLSTRLLFVGTFAFAKSQFTEENGLFHHFGIKKIMETS